MKNIMFGVVVTSMLSGSALAADLDVKCYENKEFMKIIDDMDLVTVYNGRKSETKVNDILMTKDRRLVTVEYDKASDGNALAAKQYCVTGILTDITFNDSVVEFLYNLLEKAKGQKV
jgi:hypothetical protein